MVYANMTAAKNAILAIFNTAWNAQGGTVPPVIYDDIAQEHPVDGTAWCRCMVKHTQGYQPTVGGAPGARRFRRTGMVVCQIFTKTGDGGTLNDQYVEVALAAFEGVVVPDGVFFYKVTPKEVGQNDNWFQTNVIAMFEWDQIR